ncbi:hypothetical protein D1AOALGA4SA_3904 [Olavius algarvensis Delta 1 endosymbiont]|nr:hypothetical protein D1AOALGA4SA_3904 [Olavius algarvensis Delta 1 endosymbiont]
MKGFMSHSNNQQSKRINRTENRKPNPDKPEILATKALRHKEKRFS